MGPREDQHRRGWHASSPSFCQCLGGGHSPHGTNPRGGADPIKAGAGTIAPWKPRDVEHLQTIEPSAPGLWGSCKICFHLRRPSPRRRVSPCLEGLFGFVLASSTPCTRARCRPDARTPPKRVGNTQGKRGGETARARRAWTPGGGQEQELIAPTSACGARRAEPQQPASQLARLVGQQCSRPH